MSPQGRGLGDLLFVYIDEVVIGIHLEFILGQRRLHRLPVRGGVNDLPMCGGADAHRHGEIILVCAPLVHYHSGRFVEQELQPRNLRVPQVLVEDWRKVHARVLIEVCHDIFRHDVLILEVLIEVME
jgi:hypothetical protein